MKPPATLALILALLASPRLCAQPSDPLSAARTLFLNMANGLYLRAFDVATPPDGANTPWGVKVTWEQAPGCPDWGCLGVGFRADAPTGYAFDLFVESISGDAGVNVYLTESDGDRWVENWSFADLVGKGWTHVDLNGDSLRHWQFGNGVREPETIGGITFEPYGHESTAVFWLANVGIHTRTGLQDLLPLMADTDCPPAATVADPVRLPAMPRCYMGTGLSSFMKPAGQEFAREVMKRVPNLGIAANTAGAWRPEWRDIINAARREGMDVRAQNGGIDGMRGLITRAAAWGVDPQGNTRNTTPGFGSGTHGVSYCHPAAREAVRRMMASQRGIGILDYEQIDYVWPWVGGPWGYGEWDIQAFRADLRELDEGLRLATGETLRFWAYLGAYGTPGLRPADLALADWDEFTPARIGDAPPEAAPRRRTVFVALTHYEWLKFAQAMGREAQTWGGQFMASMNPEDVSNGGDYLFWNRLADTGEAYVERFGNPAETEVWRHTMPYLREEATRSGKRFAAIYEVGVGGHGKPYLDREVAYCMAYDNAASCGFDDLQNEWMDEGDWAASQEGYHRDRLDQWLATAYGFNRAKADGAAMPPRRALAIGHRCVVHGIGYQPSYLLTTGALTDINTDCDFADLTLDPARWERYDILVYTPWESSRAALDALPRWLDATPGRLLITHGAVPTRLAQGAGFLPSSEIGVGSLGGPLGLGVISRSQASGGPVSEAGAFLRGVLPQGQDLQIPGGLFATTEGETLLRVGGQPLVTQAVRPNGSRVVYLDYAAGQPGTRDLDARLLRAILNSAGCTPTSWTNSVYCHTWRAGPGQAAVLWSREACERFRFEYRGDIEQRMPYADPQVDVTTEIAVPPGTYRVYDFLTRGTTEVPAADGRLAVPLRGRTCAMLYYAPDSPQWRDFLQSLQTAPRPGEL